MAYETAEDSYCFTIRVFGALRNMYFLFALFTANELSILKMFYYNLTVNTMCCLPTKLI